MKTLDQLVTDEALELLKLFGRVRYLEAYHQHSRELEQAIQELASFSDDIHYAFQVKNEAMQKRLSDLEIDLLKHTLGCHSNIPGYRNTYCTEMGTYPYDLLCEMVAKGLMTYGRKINDGRDMYFHATRKGALAIGLSEDALFRAGLHYKANA